MKSIQQPEILKSVASVESPARNGTRLQGNQGTLALMFSVLAFNAPLGIMSGFVPLVVGAGNGAGAPMAFIALGVIFLLFGVGLTTMARFMRSPGAFYSYIVTGMGREAGLAGGFVALLTYICFASAAYPFGGYILGQMIHHVFNGPDIAWWIWAAALWVAASILSVLNIEISAKLLGILLCCEIAFVMVWEFAVILTAGHGTGARDFPWYSWSAVHSGNPGLALLFGAICITGFEAVAVFREEARDPVKTVTRATYASIIFLMVFYGIGAWAFLASYGPEQAVLASQTDPAGSFGTSVQQYLGGAAAHLVEVLLVTSLFAAILASHNIIARYLFALGRDGVLPFKLGAVSVRHGSPAVAALTTAVIVALVVGIPTAMGGNIFALYPAFGGIAALGLLLLEAITALSIVIYFRRQRHRVSVWKAVVAPSLAFLGLSGALMLGATNAGTLVGGSTLAGNLVLVGISLVAASGAVLAFYFRRAKPAIYQSIGSQDK